MLVGDPHSEPVAKLTLYQHQQYGSWCCFLRGLNHSIHIRHHYRSNTLPKLAGSFAVQSKNNAAVRTPAPVNLPYILGINKMHQRSFLLSNILIKRLFLRKGLNNSEFLPKCGHTEIKFRWHGSSIVKQDEDRYRPSMWETTSFATSTMTLLISKQQWREWEWEWYWCYVMAIPYLWAPRHPKSTWRNTGGKNWP